MIGKLDKFHRKDNPFLTTIAMALSGFTEDKCSMWRKTCSNLRQSIKKPYLRAMFAFLACDKENFDEVLLSEYLEDLCKQLKLTGILVGILLTGLTGEEGLELLGNYVDLTSDVQTAALAIIYSSPNELTKHEICQSWIERAKFDIIRHSLDNTRVPGQAFVSCNFCGKSIACNMTLTSRSRSSNFTMLPPTNKPKMTCCPGCRKPLPCCALCLTNLGTPSGSVSYQQKEKSEYDYKLSPFEKWFTWCQMCRHGDHSSHVTDWFRDHVECPVTGYQCKCVTLDPASQLTAH